MRLEEVFIPTTADPCCDVILVHGIGDDVNASWRGEAGYWPLELGEALGNCAIWVASYARDELDDRLQDPLRELASRLRGEFHIRGIQRRSSFCIVARDIGGLIALRALSDSSQLSARGLVFVQTPLGERDLRNWTALLGNSRLDMNVVSLLTRCETHLASDIAAYVDSPTRYSRSALLIVRSAEAPSWNPPLLCVPKQPPGPIAIDRDIEQAIRTFLQTSFDGTSRETASIPSHAQEFEGAVGQHPPGVDYDYLAGHLAKGVAMELRGHHSQVFLSSDIPPGARWEEELISSLATCSQFIAFVTKNTPRRTWQMGEIEAALTRSYNDSSLIVRGAFFSPNIRDEPLRRLRTNQSFHIVYPNPPLYAVSLAREFSSGPGVKSIFLSIPHWHNNGQPIYSSADPEAESHRTASWHGLPEVRRLLGIDFVLVRSPEGATPYLQIASRPVTLQPPSIAAAVNWRHQMNQHLQVLGARSAFELPEWNDLCSALKTASTRLLGHMPGTSEVCMYQRETARLYNDSRNIPRWSYLDVPDEEVTGLVLRPILAERRK